MPDYRYLGKLFISIALLFLAVLIPIQAQNITADNYLNYMPAPRVIISQTNASEKLTLYGDNSDTGNYPDTSRVRRLKEIAAKFSPILYKNTDDIPVDVESLFQPDIAPYLMVDTWDLSGSEYTVTSRDTIDLALLTENPRRLSAEKAARQKEHDEFLLQLLQDYHPTSPRRVSARPEEQLRRVIYFDFPGNSEKGWKQKLKPFYKAQSKQSLIYPHPFIYEAPDASGDERYQLVIQYWLFYPSNDGGNNHEGDWEHINVSITTKSAIGRNLSENEINKILDDTDKDTFESLVIRNVDYYFHHYVMTLDYQLPGVDFYQPKTAFETQIKKVKENKILQRWIQRQTYHRIHLLKDTINTHPIGYIGADNMGLDQAIALPGARNRDSHGTYPFPGTWRKVGPFGATERVHGDKTYRFLLPPIDSEKFPVGQKPPQYNKYIPEKNSKVLTYSMQDMRLIPDWEVLLDSLLDKDRREFRRKWFWLVLPVRWGFPVVKSPGGGFIKHADLGNVSPVGPAFNNAWNRVGASGGYKNYDPHVLPDQFQTGVQDYYDNSWGFFNFFPRTLFSLPVFKPLWFYTGGQFGFNPKFYTAGITPFRFGSFVYRPSFSFSDRQFAYLLPQNSNPVIANFLNSQPTAQIGKKNLHNEATFATFGIMYNFHIGQQLSAEHTFTSARSKVYYDIMNGNGGRLGTVAGDLKFREITGSMRYNIFFGRFQPFVNAGYGWSWYKVKDLTYNNNALSPDETDWVKKPKFPFLPNTWHLGAGVEYFFFKNPGVWDIPFFGRFLNLGKPELGIRFDYYLKTHLLGIDKPDDGRPERLVRHEFGVGLVLGL